MSIDTFPTYLGANHPDVSTRFFSITPSDTVDLPFTTYRLRIGGAGDVTVQSSIDVHLAQQYYLKYFGQEITFNGETLTLGTAQNAGGTTTTFKNVQVGETLEIACAKVMATGTTATNIVGMY